MSKLGSRRDSPVCSMVPHQRRTESIELFQWYDAHEDVTRLLLPLPFSCWASPPQAARVAFVSSTSPVAIRMTWTALPITSAGSALALRPSRHEVKDSTPGRQSNGRRITAPKSN